MRHLPLLALALTACTSPIRFTDDLDLTLDFIPFEPAFDDDTLHTPYVEGTPVTVFAHPAMGIDPDSLAFESADPTVFEVVSVQLDEDGDYLIIEGVAVGEGETDLIVTRRGDELESEVVSVAFPTRAELHAAGPMFVDLDDAETTPKVLAGGLATFQVQYWSGDERLYGNRVLTTLNAQGLDTVIVEQTFLFENREWVQVSGATPGLASVDLEVDGQLLATAPFEIVGPEAIATVDIFGGDEEALRPGDWSVLVAQASDSAGERIYGVDYAWEVDGVQQSGAGDLYRYEYQRTGGNHVRAAYGDLDADVTANIGEGYVDSSNNLGCNASGLGASGAWLVGLLALRRRSTSARA